MTQPIEVDPREVLPEVPEEPQEANEVNSEDVGATEATLEDSQEAAEDRLEVKLLTEVEVAIIMRDTMKKYTKLRRQK